MEKAAVDIELWKSLAVQVPALVVFALCIGFIIVLFVKFIRETTRDFTETTERIADKHAGVIREQMNDVKRMGEECHSFQMRFAEKLEASLDRNTDVLAGLSRGVCPITPRGSAPPSPNGPFTAAIEKQ